MSKTENPPDLLPGQKRYVTYVWISRDPGREDNAPADVAFETDTVGEALRLGSAIQGAIFFVVRNRFTGLYWSHRYDPQTGWVVWKNKVEDL